MSIQERIIQYLEFKGITAYRFCKDLNFSMGYLDKRGAIGTDKYLKIIDYYPDLNPIWLLTGKGAMLLKQEEHHEELQAPWSPRNAPLLPLEYQALTSQIHIKDQQIERQDELFSHQLKTKDQQIERKDELFGHQLKTKDWQIERKDELFGHQLKTKDQQIERKDNQIDRRDEQFGDQLSRKDDQIKFLHEQIRAFQAQIKVFVDKMKTI